MTETCLQCGREIHGPKVTVPEGDTYHYACVDVEYPEACMTDDVLENLTPEEGGQDLTTLFEYLRANPYEPVEDWEDMAAELPCVPLTVNLPRTVEIGVGRRSLYFDLDSREKRINLAPLLFHAVYFGSALEREFPAYADRDDPQPRGTSRVDM